MPRKENPSKQQILAQLLFCNPQIQYNNSSLYNLQWIRHGILKIKDVYNLQTRRVLTPRELKQKYYLHWINEVEYRQIISAIPDSFIQTLGEYKEDQRVYRPTTFHLDEYFDTSGKKTAKEIYMFSLEKRENNFLKIN